MAGIIKAAGRMASETKRVLPAYQFNDVGESYLGQVRAQAAKIVTAARQEAATVKANAVEAGRQAAIEAAQATLQARLDQQLTSILAALRQSIEKIDHSRHAWQQHWEQHAVKLAVAIAERICRRELTREPNITLTWVREALEMAAGNADLVLRMNPDDLAAFGPLAEKLRREVTGLGNVQIVADAELAAGGCRVDTEFGSLDQQLEQQLARISEELLS